ncbi:MAG: hypothetical protein J6Q41_06160, partial [Firmicutes bacterium]|nr:hypothetical protein [Bacillota bacterium]
AKKFHEGTDGDINSIKESFDQAGNFFISGSTFDAMISDHSYMPEGFEDGYKGKYGISCSIFTNYRIDKMKAGSN